MNLAEYLADLRARFAGKDPRRLAGQPRGRIVFVFKELEGTQRATIEVNAKSIDVHAGFDEAADDDVAVAFVFGRLADWLAFFEDFDQQRMSALEFYGDLHLMKLLPELAHQQLSPLATRLRTSS